MDEWYSNLLPSESSNQYISKQLKIHCVKMRQMLFRLGLELRDDWQLTPGRELLCCLSISSLINKERKMKRHYKFLTTNLYILSLKVNR